MKRLLSILYLSLGTLGVSQGPYVPIAGGTMTGNLTAPQVIGNGAFPQFQGSAALTSLSVGNLITLGSASAGSDYCAKISGAISTLLTSGKGGTVDARGLTGTQACAANPFAGLNSSPSPVPVTVLIGSGTLIQTQKQWLIGASHVRIIGPGHDSALLQYTGTSALLDPYGGPGGILEWEGSWSGSACTSNAEDEYLEGLSIWGNSQSPNGINQDCSEYSDTKDVGIWNVTAAGVQQQFTVLNSLVFVRPSINIANNLQWTGLSPSQAPATGIYLEGRGTTAQASDTAIFYPQVEQVTGCGISTQYAPNAKIYGGTVEQNLINLCLGTPGTGLNGTLGASVDAVDLEAATSHMILDYGRNDSFRNIIMPSGTTTDAQFYGSQTQVTSSLLSNVTVESGAQSFYCDPTTTFQTSSTGAFINSGADTMCNNVILAGSASEQTPFAWNFRTRTKKVSYFLAQQCNPNCAMKDFLQGGWVIETSPVTISDTPITNGRPYQIVFIGEWMNNNGSIAQAPPIVILDDTHNTFTYNGITITFSISGGKLTAVGSSGVSAFEGEIFVIPSLNSNSSRGFSRKLSFFG